MAAAAVLPCFPPGSSQRILSFTYMEESTNHLEASADTLYPVGIYRLIEDARHGLIDDKVALEIIVAWAKSYLREGIDQLTSEGERPEMFDPTKDDTPSKVA